MRASCSIQDFRIAGEIVPDTLDAVTNLFGELHRQADQQYKAIGATDLHINSPGGSVSAARRNF